MRRTGRAGFDHVDPALMARLEGPRFEVFPSPKLARHAGALPPGATVSITCSPRTGIPSTLDAAATLLRLGHPVVPHLAARMVGSAGHLASVAGWLADHQVDQMLVIGGDATAVSGPYGDALALIEGLLGSGLPLAAVGISGYPDGHPLISAQRLDDVLLEKQEVLDSAGVGGWVSTQMCFDPDTIRRWVERVRDRGLHLPVKLGVPGAVTRTKLLAMGLRLGIGTSLRFLRGNRASLGLLAPGGYDPMQLLAPLAADLDRLGIGGLHLFTFNQVAETEAWRRAALGLSG